MWKIMSLTLGITVLICTSMFSQVDIDEPAEVQKLKQRFRSYNSDIETVSGWRVQIIATTERRVMDQQKMKFRSSFSDLRYVEEYKKPYYRLTTGASLDKLSILPLLERIKRVYPSSFIVSDARIKKEELIGVND